MSGWRKYDRKQNRNLWVFSVIGLIIVCWIVFLCNLGKIGLIDKTEALYVEIAHQIVLTNNWINPQWNGDFFYSYPIGGSWLMALSFKIFGVSEWAARFPVALSAIAVVALSFYTLRYFGATTLEQFKSSQQLWITAWIGAGIVAINPAWVAWGRVGVSDMLLSSGISLAMLSFFLGYAQVNNKSTQKLWYIAFPVFMAIAVLVKGPIGFILPVFGIGCFLLYVGKLWEVFWEVSPIRTTIIFSVITLPWYIAAIVTDENFFNEFLGFSNFQRFTNVLYNHPGPWYFYIIWITVLMLPWSIYFPIAIASLNLDKFFRIKSSPRQTHLGIFAFFWFISIFLFFSAAATKLPGYILPLIPAVAIIIGLFWGEQMGKSDRQSHQNWFLIISGIFNIIILIVLAVAGAISANLAGSDPSNPTFDVNLRASGLPIIAAIIWGLAALAAIFLLFKAKLRKWLWSPNLIGFFVFIAFVVPPLIPLLDTERQLPFRQLSILIKEEVKPEEEVFLMGFTRYSIVYYSQNQVEFFDNVELARNYLQDSTKSQSKSPTVLILSEQKFIDNFELNKQDYQLINQKGVYKLIRVEKNILLN